MMQLNKLPNYVANRIFQLFAWFGEEKTNEKFLSYCQNEETFVCLHVEPRTYSRPQGSAHERTQEHTCMEADNNERFEAKVLDDKYGRTYY